MLHCIHSRRRWRHRSRFQSGLAPLSCCSASFRPDSIGVRQRNCRWSTPAPLPTGTPQSRGRVLLFLLMLCIPPMSSLHRSPPLALPSSVPHSLSASHLKLEPWLVAGLWFSQKLAIYLVSTTLDGASTQSMFRGNSLTNPCQDIRHHLLLILLQYGKDRLHLPVSHLNLLCLLCLTGCALYYYHLGFLFLASSCVWEQDQPEVKIYSFSFFPQ